MKESMKVTCDWSRLAARHVEDFLCITVCVGREKEKVLAEREGIHSAISHFISPPLVPFSWEVA